MHMEIFAGTAYYVKEGTIVFEQLKTQNTQTERCKCTKTPCFGTPTKKHL